MTNIKQELDGDCKGMYVEIQSCIFVVIYHSDMPLCTGMFRKAEFTRKREFIGVFFNLSQTKLLHTLLVPTVEIQGKCMSLNILGE